MIVSFLAVLKSGGAYVPLDLDNPVERLRFIIQDSGAQVLIEDSQRSHEFDECAPHVLDLRRDAERIARRPATNVKSNTGGGNLAYIMYTSGSTGKPKGTCITHRGISRLVWNTNYATFDNSDVFAQVSSAAFDAATFEIWGALLRGGCVVGIPRETALSPVEFAHQLKRDRVTAMFLTTPLFNQIATYIHCLWAAPHWIRSGSAKC
jgi:non-ribosomal peptide synthetase component F